MKQLKGSANGTKPLLSMSIHRMMDELDAEIKIQKQEAINRLQDGDLELIEDDDDVESERLWVEKYRPKRYTDLMGDEVTEAVQLIILCHLRDWIRVIMSNFAFHVSAAGEP